MFTANEILDIAIRLEKNGENIYRRAIEKIAMPELASALEWVADEEVRHAKWFSDLKRNTAGQSIGMSVEEIGPDFLGSVIGEQSFSLQGIDFTSIDQVSELLDIFIEFENDGILFYEMLLPFIRSESARELLETIIAEEREHIKVLKERIAELAKT